MISPEDRKAWRDDILAGVFFLMFLTAWFTFGFLILPALLGMK